MIGMVCSFRIEFVYVCVFLDNMFYCIIICIRGFVYLMREFQYVVLCAQGTISMHMHVCSFLFMNSMYNLRENPYPNMYIHMCWLCGRN